jgi:hypothetical protein
VESKRILRSVLVAGSVAGLALFGARPASAGGHGHDGHRGGGRHHGHHHHGHDGDGWVAGISFLAGAIVGAAIEDDSHHGCRPPPAYVAMPAYAPPPMPYVAPPAYPMPAPAPVYAPMPTPAPVAAPAPACGPCATPTAPCCLRVYVPPTTVIRETTVCEPAAYEEKRIPVYEDATVPVYEEKTVSTYEDRCVPIFEDRCDPATGATTRVHVGDRTERVVVGERMERVVVGTRIERTQVGERIERVLVRPETKRLVRVPETLPGRYVVVCESHDHRHASHEGEVMTRAQYGAAMTLPTAGE